jgi:hypothetical protein
MLAFFREWGGLIAPLVFVVLLVAVFLRAAKSLRRTLSGFVALLESVSKRQDSLEHQHGVHETNLDIEQSARGGSDASLDMKCFLLADYLGMEFVRAKEGGWLLTHRKKGGPQ